MRESIRRSRRGRARSPSASRRIAVRDSIYAQARTTLRDTVAPQLRTMKIGSTQRIRIDNAVLMARRVYLTDLDAFDAALSMHGGDLRRTITVIVEAAKADRKHPFDAVRRLGRSLSPQETAAQSPAR